VPIIGVLRNDLGIGVNDRIRSRPVAKPRSSVANGRDASRDRDARWTSPEGLNQESRCMPGTPTSTREEVRSSRSLGPRPPLRVALVSTQKNWHGGEDQAALLAEGLQQRGHQCLLLAREDGEFTARMQRRGWHVTTFAGRGRSPAEIWNLRRQLRRLAPEVLYFNDPHALTSAGFAAMGLPIGVRLAARRVDFPLRSTFRYRHLCDGLLCVSSAVKDACGRAGIAADRLHLVHDGVDADRMKEGLRTRGRQAIGIDRDVPLLLTVANLTDHKGHRYLMDAMPRLLARFPRLVWALAGDGLLRTELEAHADRLGVQSQVRFLGYRQDVPDLMAAADRFVIPSHMEGLCSSIADAMLAGCPVIATRAGGIPDLLDARDQHEPPAGWLVPVRDADALARAVLSSLEEPLEAERRASVAYDRAISEFTAEVMVERTLDVCYRGLR